MAVRAALLTWLSLSLVPIPQGPARADDIGRVCGPGATGLIQVGASRTCLRAGGEAPTPAADAGDGVSFLGTSHADPLLRADTAKALLFALGARGCSRVQAIEMRVISDKPQNLTPQGRRWWKEAWSAKGCGKTFPYGVQFTADGQGGTVFTLSPSS